MIRSLIKLRGIVQGVGFRPFVYNLAQRYDLKGWVLNSSEGIIIEIEGRRENINNFVIDVQEKSPPLAVIEEMEVKENHPLRGYADFEIRESKEEKGKFVPVSPDISICEDCQRELFNPGDRRYLYPFINCTNCGPRFTITEDIPYDRKNTTMKVFPLCSHCQREYEDPQNRRFHAQPNACPECGPQLQLVKSQEVKELRELEQIQNPTPYQVRGKIQNSRRVKGQSLAEGEEALKKVIKLLKEGKIVAVKGLGGFHLVCDAENDEAIKKIRERKDRTFKPFAIMSPDIKAVEKYCHVNSDERELLLSFQRPIVLLKRKPNSTISHWVAPNNNYLGVMLPYTPLHYLLFKKIEDRGRKSSVISHQSSVVSHQSTEETKNYGLWTMDRGQKTEDGWQMTDGNFLALVMTSGNFSEEPITITNEEALTKLKALSDFILMHNRVIHIRCDDSVAMVMEKKNILIRRSRGFAPQPLYLKLPSPGILACGAELKNTFCLSKDNFYFISQHIGDLENLKAYNFFVETISHFKRFFRIEPEVIAYDLHPDYLSTKYALDNSKFNPVSSTGQDSKFKLIGIQHHHAHVVSCMVENNLDEKVIGVAFDGTGYGSDGKIWGGEFLICDYARFSRFAHLIYVPIPGGDLAIKKPYRMALSFLYSLFGKECLNLDLEFILRLRKEEAEVIVRQLEREVNSPLTSSCGRLFDAVSSLIGVRDTITYEAQAAIELEMIAQKGVKELYNWKISKENGSLIVDTREIIHQILKDLSSGITKEIIAAKFHNTVSGFIIEVCQRIREKEKIDKVVLTGGVFQNRYLLGRTLSLLKEDGFKVFFHQRVPTNDAGISLGQSIIAATKANR